MVVKGSESGRSGRTRLQNAPISKVIAVNLGLSFDGCPRRGTVACLDCDLAEYCPRACDYSCRMCDVRERCPCGWDDGERGERWSGGR